MTLAACFTLTGHDKLAPDFLWFLNFWSAGFPSDARAFYFTSFEA